MRNHANKFRYVTLALAIVLGSGMALADNLNLGANYNSGITLR